MRLYAAVGFQDPGSLQDLKTPPVGQLLRIDLETHGRDGSTSDG
jgi:hypothetical protein